MKQYTGNFNVNNGTRLRKSLKDSNRNRLIKRLKDIAGGEIFQYNRGYIAIYDDEGRQIKWFRAVWCKGNCRWFEEECY